MNELIKKRAKRRRNWTRRYYDRHREYLLARNREWCEKNKERVKEYRRQYQQQHREEIRAYSKKWYEEHKEERKRRSKRWYEEHKEERKEEWRKRAKANYYKHKEKNKERWKVERKEAYKVLGGKCVFCGSQENLNFHQKSGEGHGGKRVWRLVLKYPEQFVLLCNRHHMYLHGMARFIKEANVQRKHKIIKELLKGLI